MSFKKMDPVVKAAWLEALRSGRYEQTTGVLRRETKKRSGFCCLGVVCDTREGSQERWGEKDENGEWAHFGEHHSAYLPKDVEEAINLDPAARNHLVVMNDGFGENKHSFLEIADWIEANL
jgi:hypothetical protein